jgi:elongation factor G
VPHDRGEQDRQSRRPICPVCWYLEQGESLEPEQLHDPFEAAMRTGTSCPVCFHERQSGVGVKALLEVFERLMPNPLEGNPRPFLKGEGDDATPTRSRPTSSGTWSPMCSA